jgi:serine/threonine protein kinase/Tol biopolymer transport system component
MPVAAGSRLGPYEVVASIGAGGMGEVYRARDPRLHRDVAIKVLPVAYSDDPERLRRFEQEARAAGGLNHPGILAIYDVGVHEGTPYVVSELLEGDTLREHIGGAPMAPRRVVDCAVQIALALAAAHEKGIVHRDLKPENVFITRDGRVKLLDFGLAKLAHPEKSTSSPEGPTAAIATPGSTPGLVLGTVGYMSPEQVRGQPVDHRSDIFSLGAILHEMLTGRRVFRGESAVDTMSAILREDPPEVSQIGNAIPPGFDRVVRHCLEKSPDERFQSARDLAFGLQALSGLSGLSGASGSAPRVLDAPSLPVNRRPLLWGIGLAALLPLAYWAGLSQRGGPSPTFQQLSFQRGAILSARFAPDGQTIVYGAAWGGRPFQLYSARVGSPEARTLELSDANVLSLSPSGEMALALHPRFRGGFQFAGTLARAPLAGGAPREIQESVYDAAWAPDGNGLAVVHPNAGRDRLEYPTGKVLYESSGWLSHPRFSPKGDRIAFIDHPLWPEDGGDVVVVDLAGTKRVLAAGWSSIVGLAWSPNGSEVWFTAAETGKVRALQAVTLAGRKRTLVRVPGRLTLQDLAPDGRVLMSRDSVRFEIAGVPPGAKGERDLSWLDGSVAADLSNDGKTLLFSEGGEAGGTGGGAYIRATDGSPAIRLGDGLPTALSPDGKWALMLTRTAPTQIVLVPTGAGEPRPLPPKVIKDYMWAFWLPDSKRILVNGVEEGHGLRSYMQDLEGGAPKPVTPEGNWGQHISPDGKLLAAAGGGKSVTLYPLDGGEARPLPGSLPGDRPAQWASDGRHIYVFRRDELPCRVYRIDLVSGTREMWRELQPSDPAGVIATSEVMLTPDGGAYAYSFVRILSELFVAEGLR